MLSIKRGFRLLGMLLAVLFAAACGQSSRPQVTSTPLPTPFTIQADSLPKDDKGIPLVARVNDMEITLPQFQRTLQRFQSQPFSDPGGMPKLVLQTMIQQSLIDEQAAQNNIVVTDAEVSAALQGLIDDAGGKEKWQRWLNDNNFTEDELRSTLHETLLTSRMRDRITGDLSGNVPQVHARHIIVKTKDEADALLVRLRNGEDFNTLAAQYSLDTTTSQSGGDLGWFTQEELLEPALAEVAFQLQPGQIAGPVQTSLGYHIIQTLEQADRPVDIEKRAQLAQGRFEKWLDTLVAAAKIEQYL